jgi:hypothetical protein
VTSAYDYWLTLKNSRDSIALQFGVQADGIAPETRRLADANLAVAATLAKALVDHSVLTDTQVQTALTAASSGTDGSVWSDAVTPVTGATFADFQEEPFEFAVAADDCTADNTSFARGQVGDSMLPSLGSIVIDTSTHNSGSKSAKTSTSGGWSRALRTDTYTDELTVYVRFYFKAAAPPGTSDCRLFAFQRDPNPGTDVGAAVWSLELSVDSSGHPTLIDGGTPRNPTSPPNICNNAWWRVEIGLYGATCECQLYTGSNLQGLFPDFSWTDGYSSGPVNSAVVGQPRSQLTSVQSWNTWHDDVAFATAGFIGV